MKIGDGSLTQEEIKALLRGVELSAIYKSDEKEMHERAL